MIVALYIEAIIAYSVTLFFGAMNNAEPLVAPLVLWLIIYAAEILIFRHFLKKQRDYAIIGIIAAAFALVNAFATCKFIAGAEGIAAYAVALIAMTIVSFRVPFLILKNVSSRLMMQHFEIVFFFALMVLAMTDGGYDIPLSDIICVLAAPVMGLIGLVGLRSGNNAAHSPGKIIFGGIFVVVIGITCLLQSGVGAISALTANSSMKALNGLANAFTRLAYYLAQFWKVKETGKIVDDDTQSLDAGATMINEGLDLDKLFKALVMVIIVLGIAFAIFTLIRLWKKKSNSIDADEQWLLDVYRADEYKQGKASNAWLRWIAARRFYRMNRANAIGTYIWIVRYGKKHGTPIHKGETFREYLCKTYEKTGAFKQAMELANSLEEYYYSAKKNSLEKYQDADILKNALQSRT